jgi:hypothetical protein
MKGNDTMIRMSACLVLLIACHGSNPPADPAPGGPPAPPVDPDSEPSSLPPEPGSPGDAPTNVGPGSNTGAKTAPSSLESPAQIGGFGGMGGMGGMSGSVPVTRPSAR